MGASQLPPSLLELSDFPSSKGKADLARLRRKRRNQGQKSVFSTLARRFASSFRLRSVLDIPPDSFVLLLSNRFCLLARS